MHRPHKTPKALRRLLNQLTEEDKLRKFRYAHERAPTDSDELDRFIEEIARELYNAGFDDWGEDEDEELA